MKLKEKIDTWYNRNSKRIYIIMACISILLCSGCGVWLWIKTTIPIIDILCLVFILWAAGILISFGLAVHATAAEQEARYVWQVNTREEEQTNAINGLETLRKAAQAEKLNAIKLQNKANSVIKPSEAELKAIKYIYTRYRTTDPKHGLDKLKEELTTFETIKTKLIRPDILSEKLISLAETCINAGLIDEVYDPFKYKYNAKDYATLLKEVSTQDISIVCQLIQKGDIDKANKTLKDAMAKVRQKLADESGGSIKGNATSYMYKERLKEDDLKTPQHKNKSGDEPEK